MECGWKSKYCIFQLKQDYPNMQESSSNPLDLNVGETHHGQYAIAPLSDS